MHDESHITWVTYPLVEYEENGDEYRERQEYKLILMENGLWNLAEEVSEADYNDYYGTSNLSMMDYCDGLELNFQDDTIFVDYKGYLQIKEWYTKVDSEPQSKMYLY